MENVLLERIKPLISHFIKELDSGIKGSWGFIPKRPLKIDEEYLYNCFLSIAEVITLLKQLNMSVVLLTNFRASKKIKDNEITRFDFCVYHIENHFFRITGLLDRILILVKEILNLNIDLKKCKPYYFLINDNEKSEGKGAHLIKNRNSELFKLLINMQEFINNYRTERNIITHQARFQDDRLRKVEGLNLVLHLNNSEKIQNLKYIIKNETDKEIFKVKSTMNNINNKLESIWNLLSIELSNEFFKVYNSMKSN